MQKKFSLAKEPNILHWPSSLVQPSREEQNQTLSWLVRGLRREERETNKPRDSSMDISLWDRRENKDNCNNDIINMQEEWGEQREERGQRIMGGPPAVEACGSLTKGMVQGQP